MAVSLQNTLKCLDIDGEHAPGAWTLTGLLNVSATGAQYTKAKSAHAPFAMHIEFYEPASGVMGPRHMDARW